MFSKNKPKERIDTEQREQFEYARKRINQKKRLMRHFIVFLAGSILLIIINPVLGIGKDFFIQNWFAWAILIWALLFLIHVFNVFISNRFMGKEWEDRQMDKLKAKQEKRIAELQQKLEKETPVLESAETTETKPEIVEPQDVKKKQPDAKIATEGRMITMIAAAGEKNELGKDNDLVWHLPDDFKRFKNLTSGHHIIMGRKTFESFNKPLPNRIHIVISRNKDYKPEGAIVVHSLKQALKAVESDDQPFIIGGGEIYELGMSVADKIELTRVHGTFESDTFFPEIPKYIWELVNEEHHEVDDRHDYAFTYQTWVRKDRL